MSPAHFGVSSLSERAPQRFDLLVFDWDGTLFDSTALIARCIQSACADVGAAVPSEVQARYVIGMGLNEALAHAAPGLPVARYGELGARYRHHYLRAQDELSLFDGALTLLLDLKQRGFKLAVATGKSRRGLDEVLIHSGLGRLFDATRTADETASKPDPQMLLELMDELQVAPERTLMVGDTTHDLLLARNAGTKSVGVSYGAHEPDDFPALEPLYVAHSVNDLHHWFNDHA